MIKRACCVIALIGLCLAAASAAPDKHKPVLFEQYLNAGSSSEVPAKMAEYYERVKTETICLKAVKLCDGCHQGEGNEDNRVCTTINEGEGCNPGCGCRNNCKHHIGIANFACAECHPEHYYDGHRDTMKELTLDVSPEVVSRCVITEFPAAYGTHVLTIDDKPNVKVAGTFTASCMMKDDKDTCGHPDICGDGSLTVQGVIYLVEQAVVEGAMQNPNTDFCAVEVDLGENEGDERRTGQPRVPATRAPVFRTHKPRVHKKAATGGGSGGTSGAGNGGNNNNNGGAANGPKVGAALVYMGNAEVSSRHHISKFDGGYWQWSRFVEINEEFSGDIHGLPRLGHETVIAQFVEREEKERY